jgi:hypothetical protein
MTKKKECKAAVLAILDAPDSEPIVATLVCHCEAKRSATKKKGADTTKKKTVEKRKANGLYSWMILPTYEKSQ